MSTHDRDASKGPSKGLSKGGAAAPPKSKTKVKSDGRRPERVAARVREELALILARELSDPRLALINIARVEASADLASVRVGVTVLGDDDKQTRANSAAKVLISIAPTLRAKLAPALGMRHVPKLTFQALRADGGARLEQLLEEVAAELAKSDKPKGP